MSAARKAGAPARCGRCRPATGWSCGCASPAASAPLGAGARHRRLGDATTATARSTCRRAAICKCAASSEATLARAHASASRAAGLLDASPEAEAVRNVLVSPFAGLDPGAAATCALRRARWKRALSANPALWALPGKFGFSFDAGAFPLGDDDADLAFVAVAAGEFVVRLAGAPALGPLPADDAVAVALRWRARSSACAAPRRMREALRHARPRALRSPRRACGRRDLAAASPPRPVRDWLGAHALGARGFRRRSRCRSAASPPPTCARSPTATAQAARRLRLTPWRALLVPGRDIAAARRLAHAARGYPRRSRRSPARRRRLPRRAGLFERASATRDAPRPRPLSPRGQASRCMSRAAPRAAPIPRPRRSTVVATPRGYDLVSDGRADADARRARALARSAAHMLMQEFGLMAYDYIRDGDGDLRALLRHHPRRGRPRALRPRRGARRGAHHPCLRHGRRRARSRLRRRRRRGGHRGAAGRRADLLRRRDGRARRHPRAPAGRATT